MHVIYIHTRNVIRQMDHASDTLGGGRWEGGVIGGRGGG